MDERTLSIKISSDAAKLIASRLEMALKALAKLLVSIRFYPAGHPALKDVTNDAKLAFKPLLQGRECLVVGVHRSGFSYEDEPVAPANAMLQKLAGGFFIRKISRITILKDLSCRDLWETAKILLFDVDVIRKAKGIQPLLLQAKVTTLWMNIVDINGVFDLKNKIDAEKLTLYGDSALVDKEFLLTLCTPPVAAEEFAAATGDAALMSEPLAGELPFEDLLKAVQMASGEHEFSALLQRLIPVVGRNLTEKTAHLVLQTLSFLAQCGEKENAGEFKCKAAQRAMAQLSSPALLSFYVNLLCAQRRFDDHRIAWDKINQILGDPLAKRLLTRLSDEDDPLVKKVITAALVSQGPSALAAIVATLQVDRWRVLRNALFLLGEIRDVAAIEPLRPLLRHRDLRVRREALRALTRIGGNSVVALIAKILQGDDNELRRQALLCLGAIKTPASIPLLVQFLQVSDWQFLQLDAKIDAVRALGEIGSADVLSTLMIIVKKRCLFYRRRNDELRAAALLAIAEIGGAEAIRFLEIVEHTSNHVVAKAASNAIKQARKGHRYD